MTKTTEYSKRVVIIGAGIGGLSCAIALKQKLGFENFTIFEKASDVGGTWRDNTYPGCGSDVQAHLYSLSSDLKPDWETVMGTQPEIQTYWKDLTEKYALRPRIAFNTRVILVRWDVQRQLYHVTVEEVGSRRQRMVDAEIVISAIGILEEPRYPDIAGIDKFEGELFHSGRWDHRVSLSGKRVGVIGNGSSATQFVPFITNDPTTNVVQFIRTPSWYLEMPKAYYPEVTKWIFAHVPGTMRFYRNSLFFAREFIYTVLFGVPLLNRLFTKIMIKYLYDTCPKEYQQAMLPKHTAGCKRLMMDDGYLSSLHRPNLTPQFDGILRITESGIKTNNEEHLPLDVIIFATGYFTDKYPFPITGVDGTTIQKYYDEQKGPTAYLGTTVPGFPNFYMLSGPNTVTGHTSVIFMEEVQIDYILKMVKPILDGAASSFEVTRTATDKYNAVIQRRLSSSVLTRCVSWYRAGGDGKISSVFPGAVSLYWLWMKTPVWSDYKVVGAERWASERKWAQVKTVVQVVALIVACIWLYTMQSMWDVLRDQPFTDTVRFIRDVATTVFHAK